MFKLKLYDRTGNELSEGDIVKISDGRNFTFFSEVKYLSDEKCIAPFHTFSFHSFEKIDILPDGVIEGKSEPRYKMWYMPENKEEDTAHESHEQYLMSWRQCEHLLGQDCFRIEKEDKNSDQLTMF